MFRRTAVILTFLALASCASMQPGPAENTATVKSEDVERAAGLVIDAAYIGAIVATSYVFF